MKDLGIVALIAVAVIAGCNPGADARTLPAPDIGPAVLRPPSAVQVDSARLLEDLRYLSAPDLAGRASGSPGNVAARDYIVRSFQASGASGFDGRLTWDFPLQASSQGAATGSNVLGMVRGIMRPDRYIVVSAHYDHLGTRAGAVFHGADDNASGTAALLELARYFAANRPRNSIIFAAFDAEEQGIRGARAFVDDPPVPLEALSLNINMDMIGRNERRELFVAGTFAYPFLNPLVDAISPRSGLRLLKGHDRPDGSAGDDWTSQSDHAAFHAKRIPFLYFGVEDHPDYHRPTDTFERIQPGFYVRAVETVLDAILLADQRLEEVEAASLN